MEGSPVSAATAAEPAEPNPAAENPEEAQDDTEKAIKVQPETSSQPTIWYLVGVQFLFIISVALSVAAYPYVWTYTDLAKGDKIRGASLNSLASTINAVCELLSASMLGVLSDRFGRKPFMLLACVGQAIDFLVAAGACQDRTDYSYSLPQGHQWMFASKVIAGSTGGFIVFVKAAVGDISTPATASRNFALLIGMIGVAFIMGPPVGALLARDQLQLPMLVASGALLINILVLLPMKEPLLPENQTTLVLSKFNPLTALQFLYTTPFLRVFAAMAFLDQLALVLLQTILLQYCQVVFNASRGLATSLLVVFGLGQGMAYGLVLRPIVKRQGEIAALELGYCLTCFAFFALAVISYSRVFWFMYVGIVLLALGAISNPAESALASGAVEKKEQGKLQAANSALDVLGKITGSFGVYLIFEPTARVGQPGIIWFCACLIMVPGVVLAFRLKRLLPPPRKYVADPEPQHDKVPPEVEERESDEDVPGYDEVPEVPEVVLPGSG